MEFFGEEVRCSPLPLRRDTLLELERNLVLCYTGKSRLSGDIHANVTGAYQSGERDTIEAIEAVKEIAREIKDCLLMGDLDHFASLLLKNWENQKRLHPSVTNEQIESLFEAALEAGALGGKACGAGGGGCLLFFCRPATKHRVVRALRDAGVTLIDFQFDHFGAETWWA
jgi:D-glycero-alpha-D-manno-heptose-7-phosphate kinase